VSLNYMSTKLGQVQDDKGGRSAQMTTPDDKGGLVHEECYE
jgi:hypothetical protein